MSYDVTMKAQPTIMPFGMADGQAHFEGVGTSLYLVAGDGTRSVIQVPGSATVRLSSLSMPGQAAAGPQYGNATVANAINQDGVFVGAFQDNGGMIHGYVCSNGVYQQFDVAGAKSTQVQGIDQFGNLMGIYTDQAGLEWSFQAIKTGFKASDLTTDVSWSDYGSHYVGPVAGITDEYITATHDNINVMAQEPDMFIHTGSGMDAIDVSSSNGTNVLDGGTGSNFLRGGTGTDTFFADDRGASSDIWSTIAGFHAGDMATIWGVTPDDHTNWHDDQGASGFQGLTVHVQGGATASVTLAGYSMIDLGGRLQVSYGTVDGNDYMMVKGV